MSSLREPVMSAVRNGMPERTRVGAIAPTASAASASGTQRRAPAGGTPAGGTPTSAPVTAPGAPTGPAGVPASPRRTASPSLARRPSPKAATEPAT